MARTRPPEVHERASLPASAVWLARAYLGVSLVALLAGGAAAIVMRVELWSAGMQGSAEQYECALRLHRDAMLYGVLAVGVVVGLGHLQIGDAARARPSPTAWLGVLGLASWLSGVALLELVISGTSFGESAVVGVGAAEPQRSGQALVLALALIALALLLNAGHFAVAIARGMRGASSLARATSVALLLAIVWQCVCFALSSIEVASFIDWQEHRRFFPLPFRVPNPEPSMTSAILGALALAVHAIARSVRADPRGPVPVPVLYLFGLHPAFWLGVGATVFLSTLGADTYVHDTYFVVGITHLFASIVVLVFFVGVHAWCDVLFRRRPHELLARMGCLSSCVGMLGTSVAMLQLGLRGMPRRYLDYPFELDVHHRALTCAALVAVVGALFVAASIVAGRSTRERA